MNRDKAYKFIRSTYVKLNVFGVGGFFLGTKLVDWVLFDEKKMELVREQLEEEFWKKYGEPQMLKPSLVPSFDPKKQGEMRQTWIKIEYEKDSYVPKIEKED